LLKTNKTTSRIAYLKSDIYSNALSRVSSMKDGATVIIPHVCNNINVFGAGFAKYITGLFPEVKENFHMLGHKAKLGNNQYISVKETTDKNKIIICNMIAQNGTIHSKNQRPLNYASLVYCMTDIRRYTLDIMKISDKNVEIHAPQFGTGLAGGNWNFISCLIDDIWKDLTVYIYIKPEIHKR